MRLLAQLVSDTLASRESGDKLTKPFRMFPLNVLTYSRQIHLGLKRLRRVAKLVSLPPGGADKDIIALVDGTGDSKAGLV